MLLLDDETMNILMSVFFEFKEGSYDADGSDGDGKERTDEGCQDAVYGRNECRGEGTSDPISKAYQ